MTLMEGLDNGKRFSRKNYFSEIFPSKVGLPEYQLEFACKTRFWHKNYRIIDCKNDVFFEHTFWF